MPVDPAPEEAPQPQLCSLCGDPLLERQAGIQASCSVCGAQYLHIWCATSYAASRVRQHSTNSRAIEKRTRSAQKHPWRELVTLRCPRGWQHGTEGSKGQQGGSWEARHACSGRIQTAELIDAAQEGKKKKKRKQRASVAVTPAGPRQHAQQQHACAGSSRAAVGLEVKMSMAAAQAFLGVEPEDEAECSDGDEYSEEDDWAQYKEDEEGEWSADWGAAEEAASGAGAVTAGIAPSSGTLQFSESLNTSAEAAEPPVTPSGTGPAAPAAAPASPLAQPAAPLTVEEAEVAVREGLLPPTYRTQMCSRHLSGLPCRRSAACPDAHSLNELRVDAAIEEGMLPESFKTVFCASLVQTGSCPFGRACMSAHSLKEVRVRASIEAGIAQPAYKTQLCSYFTVHGNWPCGLLCSFAHGREELRREAAVQCGYLHSRYKTLLCDAMMATGMCRAGDVCPYAHGVADLRRHAAIRDKLISPAFKTMLCCDYQRYGACENGHRCTFAHGLQDRLPHLITRGTLCPIFQETGRCEPACPFAHEVSELQLPLDALQAKVQRLLGARDDAHSCGDGSPSVSSSSTPLSLAARRAAWAGAEPGSRGSGGGILAGGDSALEWDWGFTAGAAAGTAEGSVRSEHIAHSEGGSKAPSTGGAGSIGLPSEAAAAAQQVARPQLSQRGPRQKAPKPFEVQLAYLLGGKPRSFELRPCRMYDDCGKCWTVECPYAHGPKELYERERSWVDRETERRRQRHQQWLERQRQQREVDVTQQHQQQRHAVTAVEHQEEPELQGAAVASAQLKSGPEAAAASCQVAAPIAQLSKAALALLRGHKLQLCSLQLMETGFEDAQSRAAAEAAGAEVERAFELALGAPSGRPAPPVDVTREAGELLALARGLGLCSADVEQALVLAAGDWEEAQRHLSMRAARSDRAGSGGIPAGQAPAPLPLPIPLPVPVSVGGSTSPAAAGAAAPASGWGADRRGPPAGLPDASWLTAAPSAEPDAASADPLPGSAAATTGASGAAVSKPISGISAAAADSASPEAAQQAKAHPPGPAGFESFVDVISSAWQEGQQQEAAGKPPMPVPSAAMPAATAAETPFLQPAGMVAAVTEPPEQPPAGGADASEPRGCSHAAAAAAVGDGLTAAEREMVPAPPAGQHPPAAEDQQEPGVDAGAQPAGGPAGQSRAAASEPVEGDQQAAPPADGPHAQPEAQAGAEPGLASADSRPTVGAMLPAKDVLVDPGGSAASEPLPAAQPDAKRAAASGEHAVAAVGADAADQHEEQAGGALAESPPAAGSADQPVPAGGDPATGVVQPATATAEVDELLALLGIN